MKKIIYSLVIMIAAGSLFTSCIQPVEEAGLLALRTAKAKYIESLTGLKAAEALKTTAEAEYIEAQAEVEEAQAEVVEAQAAYLKAQALYVAAETKVKEAEAEYINAQAQALLTKTAAEAATLNAEAELLKAQAEAAKLAGQANYDLIEAQAAAIAKEAEAAYQKAMAEAKAAQEKAEAEAAVLQAQADSLKKAGDANYDYVEAQAAAAKLAAEAAAAYTNALTESIESQTAIAEAEAAEKLAAEKAENANKAALEAEQLKAALAEAQAALIAAQTKQAENEKALALAQAALDEALKSIAAESTQLTEAETKVVNKYIIAYKNLIEAKAKLFAAQEAYDLALYDTIAVDLRASDYADSVEFYTTALAAAKEALENYGGYEATDFQAWDNEIANLNEQIKQAELYVAELQKEWEVIMATTVRDGVTIFCQDVEQWWAERDTMKEALFAESTKELVPSVLTSVFKKYIEDSEIPNVSFTEKDNNPQGLLINGITLAEETEDVVKATIYGSGDPNFKIGLKEIAATLSREKVVLDGTIGNENLEKELAAAKKAYESDRAALEAGFYANDCYKAFDKSNVKKANWNTISWRTDTAIFNMLLADAKSKSDAAAKVWSAAVQAREECEKDSIAKAKALDSTICAQAKDLVVKASALKKQIVDISNDFLTKDLGDSTAFINAVNEYFKAKRYYTGPEALDTIWIIDGVKFSDGKITPTFRGISLDGVGTNGLSVDMCRQTIYSFQTDPRTWFLANSQGKAIEQYILDTDLESSAAVEAASSASTIQNVEDINIQNGPFDDVAKYNWASSVLGGSISGIPYIVYPYTPTQGATQGATFYIPKDYGYTGNAHSNPENVDFATLQYNSAAGKALVDTYSNALEDAESSDVFEQTAAADNATSKYTWDLGIDDAFIKIARHALQHMDWEAEGAYNAANQDNTVYGKYAGTRAWTKFRFYYSQGKVMTNANIRWNYGMQLCEESELATNKWGVKLSSGDITKANVNIYPISEASRFMNTYQFASYKSDVAKFGFDVKDAASMADSSAFMALLAGKGKVAGNNQSITAARLQYDSACEALAKARVAEGKALTAYEKANATFLAYSGWKNKIANKLLAFWKNYYFVNVYNKFWGIPSAPTTYKDALKDGAINKEQVLLEIKEAPGYFTYETATKKYNEVKTDDYPDSLSISYSDKTFLYEGDTFDCIANFNIGKMAKLNGGQYEFSTEDLEIVPCEQLDIVLNTIKNGKYVFFFQWPSNTASTSPDGALSGDYPTEYAKYLAYQQLTDYANQIQNNTEALAALNAAISAFEEEYLALSTANLAVKEYKADLAQEFYGNAKIRTIFSHPEDFINAIDLINGTWNKELIDGAQLALADQYLSEIPATYKKTSDTINETENMKFTYASIIKSIESLYAKVAELNGTISTDPQYTSLHAAVEAYYDGLLESLETAIATYDAKKGAFEKALNKIMSGYDPEEVYHQVLNDQLSIAQEEYNIALDAYTVQAKAYQAIMANYSGEIVY